MTETGNGGLRRPTEESVRANSGAGQDFNEVNRCGFDLAQIANMVDHSDQPPHEWIAAHISSNDANDKVGIDAVLNRPTKALRSWGFDVEELNRSYALVIFGGKAMVVNEQPFGPANDRVRFLPFEAMNSWFGNKFTEIVLPDGRIRPVTWAKAWHQHPDRRQYEGVEYFPNPDGANGTPKYLNLWRGFSVNPSSEGSCEWRQRNTWEERMRVEDTSVEDVAAYRAVERIYHSYLTGLVLHISSRAGAANAAEVVFRMFRRQQKTHFVASLKKLGWTGCHMQSPALSTTTSPIRLVGSRLSTFMKRQEGMDSLSASALALVRYRDMRNTFGSVPRDAQGMAWPQRCGPR